jgi:hypothetical protein
MRGFTIIVPAGRSGGAAAKQTEDHETAASQSRGLRFRNLHYLAVEWTAITER